MTAQPASLPATRRRHNLSLLLAYVLVTPPVLVMVFLIFLPALQALVRTLLVASDASGVTSLSLARYIDFFSSPISRSNLWFTIWVTLVTVALLFALCFPLALYLRFSNSRIAGAVQVLSLFPLFVPGIILAFALIRFIGPHGTVDSILHLLGATRYTTPYLTPSGIIIGLVWDNIPFTVLVLTAGLRQVDDALIECARDVGANQWQIFQRILLPLIKRPALIVFCLNVIGVFGSFTIPYLLGPAAPQMMGVYMQQTYGEYQDKVGAETQAVITFLFSAVVGFLYVRTIARQSSERK
jgi:ABC-type spermidine/putrescine transport system permease subunit I